MHRAGPSSTLMSAMEHVTLGMSCSCQYLTQGFLLIDVYALQGIGALRHGEAAGLCWRHYDSTKKLLGRPCSHSQ